jgi:hypothetical protein
VDITKSEPTSENASNGGLNGGVTTGVLGDWVGSDETELGGCGCAEQTLEANSSKMAVPSAILGRESVIKPFLVDRLLTYVTLDAGHLKLLSSTSVGAPPSRIW